MQMCEYCGWERKGFSGTCTNPDCVTHATERKKEQQSTCCGNHSEKQTAFTFTLIATIWVFIIIYGSSQKSTQRELELIRYTLESIQRVEQKKVINQ